MGETRVDLHHLLEDLRDAYPGALEETILTEAIANSLDSGAACLSLTADPASSTLTIVDDGSGMRRRDLVRYHDLASSAKTRGHGIGFAGVGIKLGLLVCEVVVTEDIEITVSGTIVCQLFFRLPSISRLRAQVLPCQHLAQLHRTAKWCLTPLSASVRIVLLAAVARPFERNCVNTAPDILLAWPLI